MRHRLRCRHLRAGQRHGQQGFAFAPAPGSRGMIEAPGAAALIAPAGLTLRLLASLRRTTRSAIDLAPVTAAAHQRWHTAACAQKASRGLVAHVYPGELPRGCCWTGSSTGATLSLHPLSHDTVKGTANGSNFQVRAAAVPAYLGVGRLQRHDQMRHHWRPAHRAALACRPTPTCRCTASMNTAASALPITRPTSGPLRAWPPGRAARHAGLRDPQSPKTRTASSQPENSAS